MKFLILLAGLFLFRSVHGQENARTPYIEVAGQSETQVVPDRIQLLITLVERGVGSGKISVESQELWLKNAVKNLGLDTGALSLRDAIADLVPKNFRKDDLIARKRYLLEVTDAETVRKVFAELDRLQIHDVVIHRVAHSQESEIDRDMRIKAIQNARQKADDLLAAIGERTGTALEVSEIPHEPTRPKAPHGASDRIYGGYQKHRLMPEPETYQDLGIGFSHISIKAQVFCVFAIAPR